jgi:phage-related protein
VQKLLYFVVRLDLIEGYSIRLYRAPRNTRQIEDVGSNTKNSSTYSMHKFLTTHGSSRSFVLERPCALSHVGLEVARYVESNLWVQREVFIA